MRAFTERAISIRRNVARGRALRSLIESHEDYLRLGREPAERQATYRDLFRVHIDPETLKGVRQATQSNRVFAADYSQTQIEAKLALRIAKQKPGPRRRETSPR